MCCEIVPLEQYLGSAKDTLDRIKRIDTMIDLMLTSYHTSLVDASINVSEYQMNDGQMIVKTVYKTSNDILAGIQGLEKLKQDLINRYNGRVMTTRDIIKLRRY